MRSSTVIVIFVVFFAIWLYNTGRLARIAGLYRNGSGTGSNIIDPETGAPSNAGTPPISGAIGTPETRKTKVERKRKTNPDYLPPVIP